MRSKTHLLDRWKFLDDAGVRIPISLLTASIMALDPALRRTHEQKLNGAKTLYRRPPQHGQTGLRCALARFRR